MDGYVYSSATLTRWVYQIQFKATNLWGTGVGLVLSGNSSCAITAGATGACGADYTSFPPTALAKVGSTAAGEASWNFTGSAPSIATAKWTIAMKAPIAPNTVTFSVTTPEFRCDNTISNRKAGCINPNFLPSLKYSRTDLPQFAAHVAAAQSSGLPRRLTRMINSALRTKNGNMACPTGVTWLPRPPGYECDEYPFRSTYQGAYTRAMPADPEEEAQAARSVRTLSWCQIKFPWTPVVSSGPNGYSICMILKEQNQAAGTKLNTYYSDRRLLDKDEFYVMVVP